MKHFIWTIKTEKVRRILGGADIVANVYQIKRGMPVFAGSVEWCTSGCKGGDSEVMNHLARRGELPKRYLSGYYTGHHCGPVAGQNFTISEV